MDSCRYVSYLLIVFPSNFIYFYYLMYVINLLQTNYNLEDLDDESLAYVNRLFAERYKQWKSDLHHHFQAFADPQVALQEGCPKELEGGRIVGRGSVLIFRRPIMWYFFYIKFKIITCFLLMFI